MTGTPPALLPGLLRAILLIIAVCVPFAHYTPAEARQEATTAGQNSPEPGDIPGDIREVQRLLVVLGHLDQTPSGKLDESTVAALKSFQRGHNLPASGELDAATIAALGGNTRDARNHPRFRYVIRRGDILTELAQRFDSSVPWIARFNQALTSVDHLVPGMEIVIPIRFPLLEELTSERLEILPNRFLGTYLSAIPFSEVTELAERMANTLLEAGFEVEIASTPLEGMKLRGHGIVLGRMVYSAQQSTGKTRVHLALLFNEGEKLEGEFKHPEWMDGVPRTTP